MGATDFSLPTTEKVAFDIGSVWRSWRIPREWVIDNAFISQLKDKMILKEITAVKLKYLKRVAEIETKVAEIETQLKQAEIEMLGDLGKVLEKIG